MENDTAHLREALAKLANEWADQSTDYDEDTEQQIADGRALRELLAAHPAEPAPVAEVIRQAVTDAAAVRRCPVQGYDNAWCMRPALHDGKHEWAEAEPAPVANREALLAVLNEHQAFEIALTTDGGIAGARKKLADAVLALLNGSAK